VKTYIVFYDDANYYISEASDESEAAAEAESACGPGWAYVELLDAEDRQHYVAQD
jgi:hypothetical protein